MKTHSLRRLVLALLPTLTLVPCAHPGSGTAPPSPSRGSLDPPASLAAGLDLAFEENRGQGPPAAAFVARTAAGTLALAPDQAWLLLPGDAGGAPPLVRWRLLGASAAARAEALQPLPGVVSYLRGREPRAWIRSAPTFGSVRFHEVWPGIDALHSGVGRAARYDFELAPFADPGVIRVAVEGVASLRVDEHGALVLETGAGALRQAAPVIWQDGPRGREAVEGGFVLLDGRTFGFRLGSYDRARPLVIDPTLTFSALFGAQGADMATCVIPDGDGGWWVGGSTSSAAFPFSGSAVGPTFGTDGFVLHFDGTGTVVETLLIGGSGVDRVVGLGLDTGVLYLAGDTTSVDFPVTPGVYQSALLGPTDAFVTKLDLELSAPLYSTYWGGSGTEILHGFDVDAAAEPVLVGETTSANFPVAGGLDALLEGTLDAFAARLRSDASGPVWSGYWGGASRDRANAVDLDADSTALVVGERDIVIGGSAAFVLPVLADGTLGAEFRADGAGIDAATDVDASSAGVVWVCGTTFSPDFPLASPMQATLRGSSDAFLLAVDALGLFQSTYWGGSGADEGVRFHFFAPPFESRGLLLLNTDSTDLQTVSAVSSWATAGRDAYVADLDLFAGTLRWGSFVPGGDDERAFDLARDDTGTLAIVGSVDNFVDAPDQPADDAQGALDGINNTNALLQIWAPATTSGAGTVEFALERDRAYYGVPYEFFVYRKGGNAQATSIRFHVYDNVMIVAALDGTIDFAAGEQVGRGTVTFPPGFVSNPAITLDADQSAAVVGLRSARLMTLSQQPSGGGGGGEGGGGGGGCWILGRVQGVGPSDWSDGIGGGAWVAALLVLLFARRRRPCAA